MKIRFRAGSLVLSKMLIRFESMAKQLHMRLGARSMAEFLRSTTIVVMGLTVIGAGVFVVFYG
jgi:hypothetical protein